MLLREHSNISEVIVIKCNIEGKEIWRYPGLILKRGVNTMVIEAYFNRNDLLFHGMLLGRGDRFVEAYYTDRWYNIFEVHDRVDDHLKGWYCNVARPAVFVNGVIRYVDLALDLLVFPDGRQFVLDEDEFAALPIDAETRSQAIRALEDLKTLLQTPPSLV
ncbi:MAG: DUF402 domain-containing protein [Anaerolineae bacterium]|nr:DUF402 domain-containing protein [Anaerolineae bacterium]